MELIRRKPRPFNGDGFRQKRVEGANQFIFSRQNFGSLEVHHLPDRVGAGIGAAATDGLHRLVIYLRENVFERSLNGLAPRLLLPAFERDAVVRNEEFDFAHSGSMSTRRREEGQRVVVAGVAAGTRFKL